MILRTWCGEIETLEKIKARIDYNLDYLRDGWSLPLDLYIIAKTAWSRPTAISS